MRLIYNSLQLLIILIIILLINISNVKTILLSDEADVGGISSQGVLGFFRDGWQTIRGLIPELSEPQTLSNLTKAYSLGRLHYLKHSIYKLKQRNVNCELNNKCVAHYNISNYDMDISIEFAEYLFNHGLQYLLCCINEYNQLINKTHIEIAPLLQVLNIHRFNKLIFDIATSYKIGQIAAQLLQVESVRLYQTALFVKSTAELNQETVYHNDLNMAPVDTGVHGYLTFWCPVRKLEFEFEDSMLRFAAGSHRDMSLRHWYHPDLLYNSQEIIKRYKIGTPLYLDVGDCTVHHGWVMHAASAQPHNRPPRMALGLGYIKSDATVLIENGHPHKIRHFPDEDEISYGPWLSDLKSGDVIDHPLLPIVYPAMAEVNVAVMDD